MAKIKLRQFSLAFKVKIVKYYESLQDNIHIRERSLGFVAKKTHIHRQSLKKWLKSKVRLFEEFQKHVRVKMKSVVDRSECPAMECALKAWVIENRTNGVCIDGQVVTAKAAQIYNEIHPEVVPEGFERLCSKARKQMKFSRGWFENFLKRHSFVLRRISSTGRDLPQDTLSRINSYYTEVIFLIINFCMKNKFNNI